MKEKFKQLIRYHAFKKWFDRYERWLLPGSLLVGVIFDSFTFASIDITSAFTLLGVYVFFSGASIFFMNAYAAGRIPKGQRVSQILRLACPVLTQFSFGAMLNASFIFYFFSGTLLVSWPFILPLALLMVSNDIFRAYAQRPVVQLSVYFFILFSLSSIILPFALHALGFSIFLLAGAVSLILFFGYIALLRCFAPLLHYQRLLVSIAIIFLAVNGLYFLNIIPPLPLSIRDAALAHDVQKAGSAYILSVEEQPLWSRLSTGQTIHVVPNGKAYLYTAIFAPPDLQAPIIHHWQRFDDAAQRWVSVDRLRFTLTGGAKTGYRGFSFKSHVSPGLWRVDVETTRGQALGRVRFHVIAEPEKPKLKTAVK